MYAVMECAVRLEEPLDDSIADKNTRLSDFRVVCDEKEKKKIGHGKPHGCTSAAKLRCQHSLCQSAKT